MQQVEVVFIGQSVVSLVGALHLVRRGVRVAVVGLSNEIPIRGMHKISLDGVTATDANSFDAETVTEMRDSGSHVFYNAFTLDRPLDRGRIELWNDETLVYQRLVLAPSDFDYNFKNKPDWGSYLGYSISACAWSDAYFFRDSHVLVLGSTGRVIDQALQCAAIGCRVSIVQLGDQSVGYLDAELRSSSLIRTFTVTEPPKIEMAMDSVTARLMKAGREYETIQARFMFFSDSGTTPDISTAIRQPDHSSNLVSGSFAGIGMMDTPRLASEGRTLAALLEKNL